MNDKIKILFHTKDSAGVNYFRIQTPAQQLERDHSDDFRVEINPEFDLKNPQTIEYLKSFHIIHYHRQFAGSVTETLKLANVLRDAGVILIVDIDDYWYLDKSHPYHKISVSRKLHEDVIDNLKIADYVTTTTDLFASEIRKVTRKDNVFVFPNSIDPTWMKQFQNNWQPDPNGLVRISYMAGSSHSGDVQQLHGVVNRLNSDLTTKNKFKIIIAGWDTEGTTSDIKFNQDFSKELQKRGLWNKKMVKAINNSGGNIDLIPNLPDDLIGKFRDKIFFSNQRAIHSTESVYLNYEKILTDNHNIINDPEYIKWLDKYERDKYADEKYFARRWTQKANIYAKVLDETDISIAPLADHTFNRQKSNLKQVECWSRKIPIVCSDIPPYNVDGIHERNCMLVPVKKNADKYWYKYLKRLILDKDFRQELGSNLYDDFSVKYNLKNVTNNRAKFYQNVIAESLKLV